MTDLYLALIALGVLVMAGIQVFAIVSVARAARRVGEMADRVEQDVRPIIVNLQKVSEEAARASAQAAAQVDRLDALVANVARRVEETAATVQQTILQPARDGLALLSGLKNVIASFREPRETPQAPQRKEPQEPQDDLFIG
jgi:NADP-dependent 3-hydroxy acid dehydrogenase YdfG